MAHTGPAAQKLVEAVQEDIAEVVDLLGRALKKMREIEEEGRGVNGLATTMKARGNLIDETINVLNGESDGVQKKMAGASRVEVVSHVDEAQAERVRAAKARAS